MPNLSCLLLYGFVACSEPDVYMPTLGEWIVPPHTAEICKDLRVNKDRIHKALHQWRKQHPGYDLYQWKESRCHRPPDTGVIRFTNTDPDKLKLSDTAAYTIPTIIFVPVKLENQTNYYEYISGSTVYIQPRNTQVTILHEIGHAFSWDHALDPATLTPLDHGHLMAVPSGPARWTGLETPPWMRVE